MDKRKPFKYQKEVLREIDKFNGRVLCSLDMGLGKTPITLWWLKKHVEAFPVLIICPASLKYMWEYEVQKMLGICSKVLNGKTPSACFRNRKVIIINYDIVQYWYPLLASYGFKTLVLEESHACKNPKTKRTKVCKQLAKRVPHILALSGTPLTNRPIELFPVLNMLLPATFNSQFNFGKRYCGGKMGYWGWEFKGATNTKELHDLLVSRCMSRRLKSEVLKDLPKKNRCVIPIPMRNRDEYEEATNEFLLWLAKQDPMKVLSAQKAQSLVQLGYLKRLAAKLKVKYVVRWVNEWLENNPDDKMVLFAEHKAMIKVLKKRCKAKSVVIEGSVPSKLRYEYAEQFQTDKQTRLFIANMRAGGVGYNLTAANTVAFTELNWVPGMHSQAEDRIHRIGQTQVSWIYYFVAIGSIEEKLCSIIQSKQKVISSVLDGGRINGDLNVYSQLMKQYSEDS